MAAQTISVSGVATLRVLLNTATVQLFLSNGFDGQEVQLILQQDATGGRLVTSGNIPGIGTVNQTAGSDTLITVVFDGLLNTWAVMSIAFQSVSIAQPQLVAVVNANSGFAVFNSAAAVTLLPATAPAGIYRLTAQLVITTSFVTNTEVVMTFAWTDADQATSLVLTTAAKTAGTYLPATAGGSITALVPNSQTFYSTGAAAITYTPSVSGSAATAGAAQVSIVLERIA
jgi:hypothetical protein